MHEIFIQDADQIAAVRRRKVPAEASKVICQEVLDHGVQNVIDVIVVLCAALKL